MIPIEKLKQVRTIITHANCPDGIASAILLHDALPSAQIRFLTHGTKEYRELPAEDGMLFCDIAPPPERAPEFLPRVPVVLDHHKGAEHLVKSFTHHVFADEKLEPGVSAAVLAYREVWLPLQGNHRCYDSPKAFALLAGVRDTWQSSSPDFRRSNEQAAALTFWPVEKWLSLREPFERGVFELERMLDLGSVLFVKKLEAAKKALSQSWRTTVNNIRCVVFEGTTLTSDVAELVGDNADLIVGFGFVVEDGEFLLNVSTRSHTTFDCAEFARSLGGGGHTKAAGFTVPFGPKALNPYSLFRNLLNIATEA
jgi:uncharacterized protein